MVNVHIVGQTHLKNYQIHPKMATQKQKEEFKKKMSFMYLESPPKLDPGHAAFAEMLKKESTPEKMEKYRQYIEKTFSYYGEDTIEWILSLDYEVISSLSNDTKLMNMHRESRVPEEKRDLIKLMSPSMQYYGFSN